MRQKVGTDDYISEVIEKYADMVRRICFLYLKNEADVEDVFQEVFLKFFLHFDSFQSEQHQKAWLCRVTFNQCKDLSKSYWKKNIVSIEGMDIPYETPEQGNLIDAVLDLPPEHKELVYLYYFEGHSVPEIAEMMQKNPNTIYSLLRRIKIKLKKKVGKID